MFVIIWRHIAATCDTTINTLETWKLWNFHSLSNVAGCAWGQWGRRDNRDRGTVCMSNRNRRGVLSYTFIGLVPFALFLGEMNAKLAAASSAEPADGFDLSVRCCISRQVSTNQRRAKSERIKYKLDHYLTVSCDYVHSQNWHLAPACIYCITAAAAATDHHCMQSHICYWRVVIICLLSALTVEHIMTVRLSIPSIAWLGQIIMDPQTEISVGLKVHKKLSCRRDTARRSMSCEISGQSCVSD